MDTAFAAHLKALYEARFKSRREFARAAEGEANEEATQRIIGKVIAGDRPPPPHRLEAWADALELYGDQRQRFLDLAFIAKLPADAQPRFTALLRQLEATEDKVRVTLKINDELLLTNQSLKVRLEALEASIQPVRKDA